eukprot:GHVS01017362.1.p2 GENE.GHVS01017362.1~~GHVS01017362.1.p2  ORF type:complete len:161 (+),score=25.29 GHVS01017362.1:52-534(+)
MSTHIMEMSYFRKRGSLKKKMEEKRWVLHSFSDVTLSRGGAYAQSGIRKALRKDDVKDKKTRPPLNSMIDSTTKQCDEVFPSRQQTGNFATTAASSSSTGASPQGSVILATFPPPNPQRSPSSPNVSSARLFNIFLFDKAGEPWLIQSVLPPPPDRGNLL